MSVLSITIALLAALLTAVLLLLETFFIPGIGILAILGVGGFIGAEIYLFSTGQVALAILYAVLTLVFFLVGFYILSRNKFIRKVELTDAVDVVAVTLPEGINEGDKGTATSRLALGGTARINGSTLLEVESEDGFIDQDEAIYISAIRNNKVFVKKFQQPIN